MDIKTKYSIGDQVYAIQRPHSTDPWSVPVVFTIGSVCTLNAEGYSAEFYTSLETGKTQWSVDDIFDAKEEAELEVNIRNELKELKRVQSNRKSKA